MQLNRKNPIGSTGYNLFEAEEKILIPRCLTPITMELKVEIRPDYFGKIYPRSSLLKKYLVSCDTGVTDFRGTILILMTNNGKDPILIKPGQGTAQIVLHKKEEVVFKKVDCLSSTERGAGGFDSAGT